LIWGSNLMSTAVSQPYAQPRIDAPATPPPNPHEILWTLTNAFVPARCLQVIAELGVADLIGDEPAEVEALASRCGADPDALDRVLSLLAGHGIFRRHGRRYTHTPASRLLRSDDPMSLRAFPRMMGLPILQAAFASLEHSVRTGAPGLLTVEPAGLWAYLEAYPSEGQIFGEAMAARAAADIESILGTYDFAQFRTVADIGGGHGHLLRAILQRTPTVHGILFDLPPVIDAIDAGHDRLTTQPGDFFADPLPTADAYILMEVLHDWPDDECERILAAIQRVAAPSAKLLVIEEVLPERGTHPAAHNLDVIMLAITGGRERTSSELDELFTKAGFQPGTLMQATGRMQIIETKAIERPPSHQRP
jgi:O-methyltransferase